MPEFLARPEEPRTGDMPRIDPSPDRPSDRRHSRRRVEMLARFRRGVASTTVMLKDLTPLGARVEGVGLLESEEVVSLTLPGCRPAMAFVAWANEHCAGLEFLEPLGDGLFGELVAQYGLSGGGSALAPLRLIP